jgi:hypothetical protein
MALPVLNPRTYQAALRNFALDNRRCNWWAGTGTGKTVAGLLTYDLLRTFGEGDRILIVTTKNVATLVWPREVLRWENFERYSVAVCVGPLKDRLAALAKMAEITTVNFENLPWLIDTVGIDTWPWRIVIADESTELRGLRIDMRRSSKGNEYLRKAGGSARAMKIARVAHKKVVWWINATGEPAPNGLIDLWGQCWFIDAGGALGSHFSAFEARWFQNIRIGSDAWDVRLVPTQWADAQIKEAIRPYTMTVDARDYFDLATDLVNTIKVPLPDSAKDAYREMEKDMFAVVKTLASEVEIEVFAAGAKSMKLRQFASGAAYLKVGEPEWVLVHDNKLEAVKDIVNELGGRPVIIAYEFRSDLERLQKAFPKSVHFDGNSLTLARFCRGEIGQLLCHPKSAAHGIDGMQEVCQDVIWFSMTWRLDLFRQLNERIGAMRQFSAGFGNTRQTRIHLLVAEGTLEEEMVERVENKGSVNDALKIAMKRRG